ncbi:fungal specific transcription factor domain-containing protein [Phlyctema vagabunda]|uniref:Fungal specific transcription factor domain-containing protein n=1 Tax=Phlyctema vagabunda TaxID=108571 RepID=A0ABR4PIY9_9HELO
MSAAAPSSTHNQQRIRKARIPLSCDPCRTRKLKCDREKPCQNCLIRKEPAKCHFKNSNGGSATSNRPVNRDAMQERLNRLENLVTDLVSHTSGSDTQEVNPAGPPYDDTAPELGADERLLLGVHNGIGQMSVGTKQTFYRGTSHWGDVLQEASLLMFCDLVNELKSMWNQAQDEKEQTRTQLSIFDTQAVDGPNLLSGMVQPVDMVELLNTVPSKPELDKLITQFFDNDDRIVPKLHILHEPTFRREYAEYWENPGGIDLMWLGLLFSMLNLTMLGYSSFDREPPEYAGATNSLAEMYRIRTAQCLMVADITKCAPYTVETLIHNCIAESWDGNEKGAWMMTGVLIRAAMQMGYHRDSSKYPQLSVFQGEMRRRVWAFVTEMDSLSSFVVGLPSMIKSLDSDTAEPLNVYDWELSEDMVQLPPSRPLEQFTPVAYLICKARLLGAVGGVVDFLNSLQTDTYSRTVVTLDDNLLKARLAMPAQLKRPTLDEALKDTTGICAGAIKLEFYYHQGMCVLHRKFLASGRTEDQCTLSYKRCLESAKELLSLQLFLFKESKIRKAYSPPRWYRISFATPDFILAATIIFLELRHRKEKHASSSLNPWVMDNDETELLQTLKDICYVWDKAREFSKDATESHQVLLQMLKSLGTDSNPDSMPDQSQNHISSAPVSSTFGPITSANSNDRGGLLGTDMNMDWAAWDAFIEGSSLENAYMSLPFNEWDLNPNV